VPTTVGVQYVPRNKKSITFEDNNNSNASSPRREFNPILTKKSFRANVIISIGDDLDLDNSDEYLEQEKNRSVIRAIASHKRDAVNANKTNFFRNYFMTPREYRKSSNI